MRTIKRGAPSLFLPIIEPASTKAPDKYTVTFRLKEPSAIFLATVRSWVSATGTTASAATNWLPAMRYGCAVRCKLLQYHAWRHLRLTGSRLA
jgi:hypothetical protein